MNTCRTCKHATTAPDHAQMYARGYRNCDRKPQWVFVPGHQQCTFNPSKWEQKQ